jgi:hypothetical protein
MRSASLTPRVSTVYKHVKLWWYYQSKRGDCYTHEPHILFVYLPFTAAVHLHNLMRLQFRTGSIPMLAKKQVISPAAPNVEINNTGNDYDG